MAASDYRLCDNCGSKAFYDSNLNYEDNSKGVPFRIAGTNQYDTEEKADKWGLRLDRLGDWAVLCVDCSPRFKTQIVPKDTQ